MLELLILQAHLPKRRHQLVDHVLEDDRIVRQRRHRVGESGVRGWANARAHTLLDARRGWMIL